MSSLSGNFSLSYEVVEGLRKNSKLYMVYGYLFYKNKVRDSSISLSCQMKSKTNCPATGNLDRLENRVKLTCTFHNHSIDAHQNSMPALKTKLKSVSRTSSKSTRQVFDEVCRDIPVETSSQISFPQVQRVMLNCRSEKNPRTPVSLNEFEQDLHENEFFRKHHQATVLSNDEPIAFVFFSSSLVERIQNFHQICYDGTFYVVPTLFTQLFIISIKSGPRFIPVFSSLMKSKSTTHYKLVLEKFKSLVPNFLQVFSIGDFERASQRALRECFPNIVMQG